MQNLNLSEKKVLLVEDNPDTQFLFESMAPIIGIENYDLAENGQQAVEMAKKELYDIILMDIQMPEMDGLEATKQIRELGRKQIRELGTGKQPKIIAYTAIDRNDLGDDFDGIILKPANHNQIKKAILEVLSR